MSRRRALSLSQGGPESRTASRLSHGEERRVVLTPPPDLSEQVEAITNQSAAAKFASQVSMCLTERCLRYTILALHLKYDFETHLNFIIEKIFAFGRWRDKNAASGPATGTCT